MAKRGVFPSAQRRQPYSWELDAETAAEVDRLFVLMQEEISKSSVK
jgi:4-hydroxy-tetrahydrodipicolinate synthase